MKKKLFTLLTLLLCVCSGAWAADATPSLSGWTSNIGTGGTVSTNVATPPETTFTCGGTSGNAVSLTSTTSYANISKIELDLKTSDRSKMDIKIEIGTMVEDVFTPVDGGTFTSTYYASASEPYDAKTLVLGTIQVTNNSSYHSGYVSPANKTGYVRITIANASSSNNKIGYIRNLRITYVPTVPTITTQPTDGVYQKDATGKKLTVEATPSTGECEYQWYSCQNGDAEDTPVSLGSGNGAQTATYTIPTGTEGTFYYFCRVSDGGSNTTDSEVATVRILDQTPVSTWDLSSLTANDIQYDSFWTGSGSSFTNASAIAGNTDTTIPNSFGGDLLNGIKIGAASGITANNLFMFINYYGVYGLRVNATTYFKIPATAGKYYRITHTASMNDGENTVGFAINNSSATLIDGELTAAISNVAVPNVFIIRADASTIELTNAGTASGRTVLTKIEEVPTISGVWTPSTSNVYQNDDAPTPTFAVNTSDESDPAGKYSVAYSTVSDENSIVTVDAESGITAIDMSKTGTATIRATITSATYAVSTATVDYTITINAKLPTFTLDKVDNEISLRSTPVHRNAEPAVNETATVTMSADFLVGTSGTVAFVGEAVDGLSVSPAAFTINDGSVAETDFTITYNSASGTSGTATLRFSDGTNNKDLVIEYASVVGHEWATVGETTTWNWASTTSVLIPENSSTSYGISRSSTDINLADFDGEVYNDNAGLGSGFDALIASNFQNPSNGSAYIGTYLKFKTSVPGTLAIDFSNTGSGTRPYRYLYVNGMQTSFKSNNTTKVNATGIVVPAGEVVIKGVMDPESEDAKAGTDQYLRIYKIIFTADNEIGQKSIEITCEGGLASYSNTTDGLDFSTSNVKAYIVTAQSTTSATLQEVTKAPANTGLIIFGTKGETYNVLTTNEATAADVEGNLLEATGASGSEVAKDEAYILSKTDGKFHLCNAGTIPAGKAYLPAGVNASRMLNLSFDDSETTGIQTVNVETKTIFDGEFYNLNGQRVATPRKGLYIVNGKKVIIK